jgi:putative addiction module component (TIGR02574 family)
MREKRSGCPRAIFRRYNAAMTQQAAELLQKALSLSDQERAELACSLIDSLDATVDEGVEEAWDEEIARRIHDIDSGKVKAVPWDEVKNRISSKLTHGK